MTNFRQIFESDWCGIDNFLKEILSPVFGDYEQGYDVLTNDPDVREKTKNANITEIRHAASFDFFGSELKVFDITVGDSKRLENNKVGIQSIVRQYINQFEGALIIFHHHNVENQEWRFSYVEKRVNVKDSTSAKRYTYILGKHLPARTISDRFAYLEDHKDILTLKDLTDAFSVEVLTKQFYDELFNWYEWACEKVTFPIGDTSKDKSGKYNVKQAKDNNELNLIRLITRLMFVWFIKQKDLIPSWVFNESELNKVLTEFKPESKKDGNYYNAILQNLFFATLNKKIEERAFADDKSVSKNKQFGVKNFYRDNKDKTFFKENYAQIIERFKTVPFLNGGLFECLDKLVDDKKGTKNIEVFTDGFSREPAWMAFVPNNLFWQKNDNEHEGLIHILNRYNFTVEENSPSDVQVALDPELLGKVFENLLGTYNPETSETARKDSGSFYTPREIVSFMIDEAIKAYLNKAVKSIDEKSLKTIFDDGVDNYDFSNKKDIVNALKKMKILDPACGSGAFPMGALQRIVHIIQKCDGVKGGKAALYDLKLELIEKCLYGIDIQPIAVQICKLRFFISLICEQEKNDNASDNYGFNPLPNLETKFVAANSLIGITKKQIMTETNELFANSEIIKTKKELQDERHNHFNAPTAEKKANCRRRDKELREKLAELLQEDKMYDNKEARQLAEWNPYDQNAVSPFFDSEWMFNVTDGFDIVIGNPPYISTKGVSSEAKKAYEAEFGFSDDTYNLFTFKGLELTKKNGTLNFIIPKTFWTTQTKRNMRDLILGKNIKYIFDTANPFDAVMVDTCIIQIENSKYDKSNKVLFLDGTEDLKQPQQFEAIDQTVYLNTQNSVIFKPTERNLKIWKLYGEKVKDLYNTWWEKIETSKKISQFEPELKRYRESLKPGDVALLGCLTEGGQGLATANNGKYIAVRKSSKWANNIIESRPRKLAEAIRKNPKIAKDIGNKEPSEYLDGLSEKKIADKFDELKEKYGRDIFGQGYIYKLIDDSEIADVEQLTDDEKENGINTKKKYYVPYDKGDKDGNRWYLETPFAIAWSKENVQFLKTNSGKKGAGMPVVRNPQFNFKEGFCWNNVLNPNARLLKAKMKSASVNDVGSMSLSSLSEFVPNYYLVCLLNSELLFDYYREFINCTVNIQINDIRQIPVIIPSVEDLSKVKPDFENAVNLKKSVAKNKATEEAISVALNTTEMRINDFIENLYEI